MGAPFTLPDSAGAIGPDINSPQRRALRMFARTGGDLDFDAEDTIGCRGAAMWAVIDALVRKGFVEGHGRGYLVTDAGRAALGLLPIEPHTAAEAHACFMRRALEEAAEHAAALLPLLGLPRLVGPDFAPPDREVALDALDAAIEALDALDADPDLEPWLAGTPGFPMDAEAEPEHDEDDGIREPSLASPERHPTVPWSGNWRRHYVTRDRQDTQARWADGGRQDLEGCITDEPHDGDGEDLEAEPAEDSLGSPAGDGDQSHWAQGYDGEREADPCDGPGLVMTAAQCRAAWERKPALHALTRQAQALRSGSTMRRDPDAVTPIGPGMVLWQPLVTRDGVPVVGFAT